MMIENQYMVVLIAAVFAFVVVRVLKAAEKEQQKHKK
jgi:preprotein translocase subunit YajC